jgi:hypothetical protein
MALESQKGIVAHHAAAIVGDLDQLLAARFHLHPDARCARIQRILQQLLQHRRRTLHHLARGDLVGNMLGKYVDSPHFCLVPRRQALRLHSERWREESL